ncbi:MAG TPA: FtsX-like permease family protein [Rhizobiales bacterium]|nr:FtsX-like permease family protein [Hyphomicrobiales bacterium]
MQHPGTISTFRLAFKFARRELRSGLQGFWIFLTCLILGVGAIAIIGTLSVSIQRGMTEQGQPLLGGDIEFSVIHRQLKPDELAYVESLGQTSKIATMRGIAIAQGNAKSLLRALVEVKAVDKLYPLYGKLKLTGGGPFQPRLQAQQGKTGKIWGAFAESSILDRLKIKPGAIIKMGEARFVIHDTIKREPDRISDGLILGPRLLISHAALKATGLVKPGSLVRWNYRVKLANPEASPKKLQNAAIKKFPDAGWRIRTRDAAAPGAQRFLDRLTFFLSLTGLTALVVGGAGLGNAVRSFLERHKQNIATLKCLGASSQLVLATYLTEILIIALLGITIGMLLGALLPLIALPFLQDVLPVPIAPAIEFLPLLQAGAFGLLVTIAFSLWPLAQAKDTPASELFRGSVGQKFKWPQIKFLMVIALATALLVILAMFAFPNRYITGWYLVGITISFIVLTALSRIIMWVAKRFVRPRRAVSRLAIANLHRPGAPTPSIVLALGLGLSLFVTLALVDQNVSKELQTAVPKQAPSFFFLDVQNTQLDEFKKFAAAQPGVSKTGSAPMLRGRVQKLNGLPLRKVAIDPHVTWAFRGDRGITYSADIPEGSKIVAGKWWPKDYNGPPQVSFVDEIANGAGLKIGDTVTVNILGRAITAKITSFRKVEWESLRINFVMVFSPGTLQGAPHTDLVTVTMAKASNDQNAKNEDALLAAVSNKYKAVTAIRIKDALDAVNNLLNQLLLAIRAASSITMITGILVLAGALASGLSTRTYDAVVLKTFGATRTQLIQAFIYEYALLGLITAALSVLIGTAAAWAIIHFIMEMPWTFSLTTALLTALIAMTLTISAGLATTWRALTAKPARILRAE